MSMYGHSRAASAAPPAEIERPRASSALSNHRPVSFRSSVGTSTGRPLVQEPRVVPVRKNVSPTRAFSRISPTSQPPSYRESPHRRIEREEARSLRDALQGMEVNDEIRIHEDAQNEATELVWMHQNPGLQFKNPYAPYRNPDVNKPGGSSEEQSPPQEKRNGFRNSWRDSHRLSFRGQPTKTGTGSDTTGFGEESSVHKRSGIPRKNLKVNFALPRDQEQPSDDGLGLVGVNCDSSRGIFRNPKDQIYEEPDRNDDQRSMLSKSDSSVLRSKPRNALPQGSRPLPSRFGSIPFVDKLSRFELHKHPPTQSRNPDYRTNAPSPPILDVTQETSESVPTKDGLEIRGDDIRAATSKRRSDRSSKLPMPTAVSDRTGRPIVSFDPTWKPTEAQSPPKREIPEIQVPESAPSPPPIAVSEPPSVPVINIADEKEPTIAEIGKSREQKPSPKPDRQRPSSELSKFLPSRDRWMSTYSRAGVPTASCESCSLPIAGKVVTAAGTRFHPECFTCYHCHTALECVAFYQEPDAKRAERLADPSADEEAHSLRFYCHLDFHELFSPRCKSCKTPIEGEVVVACGAEWHVGHFFCAECGDVCILHISFEILLTISQPFNSNTPFVEKDGYAWCLNCHSRRTAPNCSGCKKPVLDDIVVTAVGGKWHNNCFVCHECGDGFGPEGRYFVKEGEPRRTAKGRIIGGPVQLAVCERCEGIRLKSSPRT